MPSSIAKPADVQARFRKLDKNETTVASTRLADVERLIRVALVKSDRDFAVETLEPADGEPDNDFRETVIKIECEAVIRVLSNPERLRNEGIDDHQVGFMSRGTLRITAEEWAELGLRPPTPSANKAFAIDLTPDVPRRACDASDDWVYRVSS